ncbi:MAG TPA: hypothetical protein VGO63_00235, partial [Candidatus Paceibacterota bacterium]|nr:hypothetical protein [Candidatus Paceibacterota bacterium]
SSKDSKENQHSKKILKILGQRQALPIEVLKENEDPKTAYALARSLKNLVSGGLVELHDSTHQSFVRLTKEGKKKIHSLNLESETTLVNTTWDGFWRIILLDLPESRKSERESLRYLLKKAGFVCLKNSAWISPYPYEHLFMNIKKDLGLTTEMMILVTERIDEETKKVLFETFQK